MASCHSLYLREKLHKRVSKRVFRDRSNPLEELREVEVFKRYRFRPVAILFIVDLVTKDINLPTKRSFSLPPVLQVLLTLRVLATGSFLAVIGDTDPRVGVATVCRVFWRVVKALLRHLQTFVHMPHNLNTLKDEFYGTAGFPNLIGCIDGTQIPIQAPSKDENDYINRKGYHSINCQMVCNPWYRFTNVVAKWPGAAHDSRILKESALGRQMIEGVHKGTLLGDSGYPCRQYLMVPYPNPTTRAEIKFNKALTCTRVVIEQSFGILKRKFPCLNKLRVTPSKACLVICATVILHNIAIDYQDTDDEGDFPQEDEHEEEDDYVGDDRNQGQRFRELITNTYFQ